MGQGLQSSSTAQHSVSSPFRGPLGGHSASPLGRQQGARRSLSAGVPEQARRTLPAGPAAAAKRISSPPGADKTRGSRPGAEPAGAGLSRFPHLPRLRCHHSPAEKTKQTPHRTEKAARTGSWDVQNGLRAVPGTTPGPGPSSLAGCGAAEATHVPRVRLPRRERRRAVHPASVPDAWTATGRPCPSSRRGAEDSVCSGSRGARLLALAHGTPSSSGQPRRHQLLPGASRAGGGGGSKEPAMEWAHPMSRG